jgi:hypothetical protein
MHIGRVNCDYTPMIRSRSWISQFPRKNVPGLIVLQILQQYGHQKQEWNDTIVFLYPTRSTSHLLKQSFQGISNETDQYDCSQSRNDVPSCVQGTGCVALAFDCKAGTSGREFHEKVPQDPEIEPDANHGNRDPPKTPKEFHRIFSLDGVKIVSRKNPSAPASCAVPFI